MAPQIMLTTNAVALENRINGTRKVSAISSFEKYVLIVDAQTSLFVCSFSDSSEI